MANSLYGYVAKEGETPTHIIDGVRYVARELPDIHTEWTNEETHPFVLISFLPKNSNYDDRYILYCFSSIEYSDVDGVYRVCGTGISFIYYPGTDTAWNDREGSENKAIADYIIWANFEVMAADGSVLIGKGEEISLDALLSQAFKKGFATAKALYGRG